MGTISSAYKLPMWSRLPAVVVITGLLLGALGVLVPSVAGARSSCGDKGCVDVVTVDGLIDDIEADFIVESIRRAEEAGDVVAVVLHVNSAGAAVSDDHLDEVARAIATSKVPVSVWIGASGSEASGAAAELARIADSSSIAPGATIGDVGIQRLDPDEFGELFDGDARAALTKSFEGQEAVDRGLVDRFDPTLVDHVGNLDSVDTEVVKVDGKEQKRPVQRVRISKLSLPVQIMHTAASPSVAYLLVVIGAALLLFEFFTAGVGVAGVVGAGFLLLGSYGVAALPWRPWALALLVASFIGFAIDMQTGLARIWTVASLIGFSVASLFLFSDFRPTWLAFAAGVVGIGAVVLWGMPSMTRARFGTPYIGREWLDGEVGEVVETLDPVGLVRLRDAQWRARSLDPRPSRPGQLVRVVGSDEHLLETRPASQSDD